ncbi:hypothetical protein SDC9_163026 [bioreactor metagenome]|uniref:Uncharacterized protein n=1 Tax=bioreactor metagenome TaxID=1076179 RepID=A0A645FQ27_9ZZZZ
MVVAQQMQDRMDGEIGQLPAYGVAVLRRLGPHPLHGNDHVAQGSQAGSGVGVPPVGGGMAGGIFEHGEGQHVGGPVHLPLVPVDGADVLIVGEQHVHLAGDSDALVG